MTRDDSKPEVFRLKAPKEDNRTSFTQIRSEKNFDFRTTLIYPQKRGKNTAECNPVEFELRFEREELECSVVIEK